MRLICVLTLGLCLTGCDRGGGDTLSEFTKRWRKSVHQQSYETLYDMLDSLSQQRIRHDLDVMRGLDAASQTTILDQLDQPRLSSLRWMTPHRYFSLLWQKATRAQSPEVQVAPRGPDSADMILTFDAKKKLPLKLIMEGDRWTWQLPQQNKIPD